MSKNFSIDLEPRKDVDGRTFYIGKVDFPGTLDFSKGVVFLVFVSDKGEEELQIAHMEKRAGE